jgi:hypothetical protein
LLGIALNHLLYNGEGIRITFENIHYIIQKYDDRVECTKESDMDLIWGKMVY